MFSFLSVCSLYALVCGIMVGRGFIGGWYLKLVKDEILLDVVENALLHLYFTISEISQFIPRIKRNQILAKFLKSKFKDPRYKNIKSELKSLIFLAKKKSDVEAKLIELRGFYGADDSSSDAKKLFDLLEQLLAQYAIDSKFIDDTEPREQGMLYLLQSQVINSFDIYGSLKGSIELFIDVSNVDLIYSFIKEVNVFSVSKERHQLILMK